MRAVDSNGVSKGYAFVKMASVRDAQAAVEHGAGKIVKGKTITIEYAGAKPHHSHPKEILCPYEKQRYCWKGDKCEFRHAKSVDGELAALLDPEVASPIACFDYRRGRCYRDNCAFLHSGPLVKYSADDRPHAEPPPNGRYSRATGVIHEDRIRPRSRSRS